MAFAFKSNLNVPGFDVVVHFKDATEANDGKERVRVLDSADHGFLPEK